MSLNLVTVSVRRFIGREYTNIQRFRQRDRGWKTGKRGLGVPTAQSETLEFSL